MKRKYHPGDFVACYLTNNEVYEQLLSWGMVIDVSDTLHDILVLDPNGESRWWPSSRWRPLTSEKPLKVEVLGTLA